MVVVLFFFSSRRRHTRYIGDWSSDVCSSDLGQDDWPLQIRVVEQQRRGEGAEFQRCPKKSLVGRDAVRPPIRKLHDKWRQRRRGDLTQGGEEGGEPAVDRRAQ